MLPTILFWPGVTTPSVVLSRYADWFYFALTLALFISAAGVALRGHFSRPYVKPMIVAVGSILTVALFSNKEKVALYISGVGITGTWIVFAVCLATALGLTGLFRLSVGKAFLLTVVFVYLASLANQPDFYQRLSSLGKGAGDFLFAVVFVGVLYLLFRPMRRHKRPHDDRRLYGFIDDEIDLEKRESRVIRKKGRQPVRKALAQVDDLSDSLDLAVVIIEKSPGGFDEKARDALVEQLEEISGDEIMVREEAKGTFVAAEKLQRIDRRQIADKQERQKDSPPPAQHLIEQEIEEDEHKIRLEKAICQLDNRVQWYMRDFDTLVKSAIQAIRRSGDPADAKAYLLRAKQILGAVTHDLQQIKRLEAKLARLTKAETKLLKKERDEVS